jgi:large subunit ribosomal protein L19
MICEIFCTLNYKEYLFYKKEIMSNNTLIKQIQEQFLKADMPQIRTWMEVEIYQNIVEWNKTRTQRYKGIVVKIAWKTALEKTITVRRKVWAFGIERIFAIHSPTIEKIDIIRQFKVRRKNIGFIRDLTWKAARLKEIK